jgi:hypothetical protein
MATTQNNVVHRGPMNATQSLEFFRANGVAGALVKTMRGGRELREYVCMTEHLGGYVGPFAHRILALPAQHNAA